MEVLAFTRARSLPLPVPYRFVMNPQRWQHIEQLYHAAQERPPQERAAWLAEACANDDALRAEVEALLAADEQAGSFMAKPAAQPQSALIGARIHRYRVLSWIGAGGMGEVYVAEDTTLQRKVALKLLPAAYTANAERVRRFEQEARAASALNHPNILTIFDTGTYQGTPFIVAELLEGEELRARMQSGPLPIATAIDYARQITAGLMAAHEKGVVHRDLKPANLFITTDGRIKILDFGLAKLRPPRALTEEVDLNATTQAPNNRLTREGTLLGTVGYMAPEQVRGREADHRADIFAFGVILYEMLAGQRAFQGESLADVLAAVMRDDPPELSQSNPEVPAPLARLVERCLAKRPADRVQSAREVSAALTELHLPSAPHAETLRLDGLPTRPNATGESVARLVKRARWLPAALLLLNALLYLGLSRALHWWPFRPQPMRASAVAQPWYEIGLQTLREGAYYQASRYLERAVQEDQQFALAHARLAEALAELDDSDESQRQLLMAAALVPDRSRLAATDRFTLEAIFETVARNFPRAIANYSQLVALAPPSEQARVQLDLGRAYEKNDEPVRAIASYQKALTLSPQTAGAHLRLGIIYGERQKDLSKADAAFQRAQALYQDQSPINHEGLAEVYLHRGMVYGAMGKLEAREQLQYAVDHGSPYQAIKATLQLSYNSLLAGKYDQAQQEATRGLNLAQKNELKSVTTGGLLHLAFVFHRRGDYVKAEENYRLALASARSYNGRYNTALVQLNLGGLLVEQGQLANGLRELQAARDYFQSAGYRNEEFKALLLLARTQRKQGDYAAAESTCNRLLPLAQQSGDPSLVSLVHYEMGRLLMVQERFPEALPHIEEQYRIERDLGVKPNIGYALLFRAFVQWQLSDIQAARHSLKEASELIEQITGGDKQLQAEIALLDAQLTLSEENFTLASSKSQAVAQMAAGQFAETHLQAIQTLGLAQARAGAVRVGQHQCQQAVTLAERLGDERLRADALWALAQTEALASQWTKAVTAAQQAQSLLARQGRRASEWQVWALIARAQRALGKTADAQAAAQQARALFQQIQQQWGATAAQRYLTRPEIRSQFAQLTESS